MLLKNVRGIASSLAQEGLDGFDREKQHAAGN
jgi:hypothetical protein